MNGTLAAAIARAEAVTEFAPPWVLVVLALGGLVLVVDGMIAIRMRRAHGTTLTKES